MYQRVQSYHRLDTLNNMQALIYEPTERNPKLNSVFTISRRDRRSTALGGLCEINCNSDIYTIKSFSHGPLGGPR